MRPTAISKTQAMTQLSNEVEMFLEKAIPAINAKLTDFTQGVYRNISDHEIGLNKLPSDVQKRAIDEIKKIYQTQGWSVSYCSGDQREPDKFFTFS